MSFWQLTEIYGERNMQRESNYEIMKHRMRDVFAQKDLVLAAEKWNLVINAKNIYVRFIARDYAVNVENGIILRADDGTEADYNEAMTLYDILSREPALAFKKYVSIDSLSSLKSTFGRNNIFDSIKGTFDHQEPELARACEKLGGVPFGKSDVGYKLPVFQELSVILQFWSSDDEFEPELKLLCDQNIMSFMKYETMMFMLSHLINRLCEEMQKDGYSHRKR